MNGSSPNTRRSTFAPGSTRPYMMASNVYEEVKTHAPTLCAQGTRTHRAHGRERSREPARAQQLAKTYSRLGATLANIGPRRNRSLPGKGGDRPATLTKNGKKNRRFTHDLALALMRLGDARRPQGDPGGAVHHLQESIALLDRLGDGRPDDNTAVRDVASARRRSPRPTTTSRQSLGGEISSDQRLAAQNRAQAIAALRQLEARGALSKIHRKSLAEMQKIDRGVGGA